MSQICRRGDSRAGESAEVCRAFRDSRAFHRAGIVGRGPVSALRFEGQLLANRGYTVLQVNFRGSGGYGLEFRRAGYRKWGTAIQDDIAAGARWAIEQGFADPERICIYGSSFGGYSALMSAAREPELYTCAVGNVGVYDMDLMFRSGDIPGSRGGTEYLELVLGTDPELHRKQSPVHWAGTIQADLMIAYGKQDDRAPPGQSTALTDSLDEAGKPYELMVTRREGHGIANDDTRREYFERLLEFLNTHLGGGGVAGADQNGETAAP